MKVKVLYFAGLRDLLGASEEELSLGQGAHAEDLRRLLAQRVPACAALLPSVACAVNLSYAPWSARLHDGDEVALIPPVSGG